MGSARTYCRRKYLQGKIFQRSKKFINFRHHEPHNFACATGSKTGNSDLFRLRVGKRVYGGSMQNVRGAFENTNIPSITYDISQLFDFIDQLADLSCLVYQRSSNTYAPYNKDWIKEKIYILLRRQASR